LKLTPEETRQIEQIHALFDAHLKAHVVDDLKVLLSTHFPLVMMATFGFICVVALLAMRLS